MPRVAFFVESDGLHRLFANAIPKVASAGVVVRFVSLRPRGALHAELETYGVNNVQPLCESSTGYPRARMQLGQLLRSERIDVLHS